jgi:hypothetical protein
LTDFLTAITCSGASASTKALILRPDFNGTPAAGAGLLTTIDENETLELNLTAAASTACTGTIDVFGFLYNT